MFCVKSCIDLAIYNQEEEKVLDINYLNEARIIEDKGCACLFLEHELNDFQLLELIHGDGTSDKKTDFKKDLGEVNISFGRKRNTNEYKGIGRFMIRTADGEDHEVKLVFNRLTFDVQNRRRDELLNLAWDEVTSFKTVIVALEDEEGNYFTLKK